MTGFGYKERLKTKSTNILGQLPKLNDKRRTNLLISVSLN